MIHVNDAYSEGVTSHSELSCSFNGRKTVRMIQLQSVVADKCIFLKHTDLTSNFYVLGCRGGLRAIAR